MRCIFCKKNSSSSTSVEHIIPESLGNTKSVLPRGVVCDSCNNYFSRKIEKPLLDSLYFREQRFKMAILSKKKQIPSINGIHLESSTKVEIFKLPRKKMACVGAAHGEDESLWIRSLLERNKGTLIMPMAPPPDDYTVSRFIAKVGLEALASRVLKVPGGLDEIIEKPELDELRTYVRIGTPGISWPYYRRAIYPPDFLFSKVGEVFEVLHEYDVLVTDSFEFYIVLAIFGVEYVLNLGGRELDGYRMWLSRHNGRSPLYVGKNT